MLGLGHHTIASTRVRVVLVLIALVGAGAAVLGASVARSSRSTTVAASCCDPDAVAHVSFCRARRSAARAGLPATRLQLPRPALPRCLLPSRPASDAAVLHPERVCRPEPRVRAPAGDRRRPPGRTYLRRRSRVPRLVPDRGLAAGDHARPDLVRGSPLSHDRPTSRASADRALRRRLRSSEHRAAKP